MSINLIRLVHEFVHQHVQIGHQLIISVPQVVGDKPHPHAMEAAPDVDRASTEVLPLAEVTFVSVSLRGFTGAHE